LTEGRIAAADGWFSGICQVVPMCPTNTIELVLPSANRSVQKSICCCTAHGRVWLGFPGHALSLKSCLFSRGSGLPSNVCFLEPTRV